MKMKNKSLIALRLPEQLEAELNSLCTRLNRTKSYILRKALEAFINDYVDYEIAFERLHDKDDEILTSDEFKRSL